MLLLFQKKEESSFFEKKEAKKLLFPGAALKDASVGRDRDGVPPSRSLAAAKLCQARAAQKLTADTLVTLDAIHCQKNMSRLPQTAIGLIVQVKANPPTLLAAAAKTGDTTQPMSVHHSHDKARCPDERQSSSISSVEQPWGDGEAP